MKLFSKNGCITTVIIACILIIIELVFHVTESTIGFFVELTNGLRPKSGTIWSQNTHNIEADQQLEAYYKQQPAVEEIVRIDDLYQLKSLLDERPSVLISSDQFLLVYSQLPPGSSQQIIPPFKLLQLIHEKQWTRTRISKGEQQLSFFFLDSDNQLLMDSYPLLGAIYDVATSASFRRTSFQAMTEFSGRIIAADQFMTALLYLPANIQRQIISNPFQLIGWYKNLSAVAISKFIVDDTVLIGFEITSGMDSQVHTFEASQLAIGYLINQLNHLNPELNISMPRP
jgi:hypothetical protein